MSGDAIAASGVDVVVWLIFDTPADWPRDQKSHRELPHRPSKAHDDQSRYV